MTLSGVLCPAEAGVTVAEPTLSTTFYGGLGAANLSLAWSALWETRETRLSAQTETWRKATTGKAGSLDPPPDPDGTLNLSDGIEATTIDSVFDYKP